jgi:hypothetical protein
MVVHWQNWELWKAISEQEITTISQQFDQALDFDYQMLAACEYQVRKYSQK